MRYCTLLHANMYPKLKLSLKKFIYELKCLSIYSPVESVSSLKCHSIAATYFVFCEIKFCSISKRNHCTKHDTFVYYIPVS